MKTTSWHEKIIIYLKQNIITIICIVISGLLLITSIPLLLPTKNINNDQTKIIKKLKNSKTTSKKNLNKYPLFGDYISNINDGTKIPDTVLNLTLIGILKSSIAKDSQALIKVGNNDEKLYLINESLPGGATLVRILDSEVFLKRNGQIERLTLPKDQLDQKGFQEPLKFED